MTPMNLVQVQFKSRLYDRYGGNAYTYIADRPLMVGDIVTVPTKFGEAEARVCRIGVPESEVEKFKDQLRHIGEPANISEGLFADFFDGGIP